ncbi:hypothetical protein ACQCT5_17075 [Sutcliffiella halmapala]
MSLYYEYKSCCSKKDDKKDDHKKDHDKCKQDCFCGKFIWKYVGEYVTVFFKGGPELGVTGLLACIDECHGLITLVQTDADTTDLLGPTIQHICCDKVTSIARTPFVPGV